MRFCRTPISCVFFERSRLFMKTLHQLPKPTLSLFLFVVHPLLLDSSTLPMFVRPNLLCRFSKPTTIGHFPCSPLAITTTMPLRAKVTNPAFGAVAKVCLMDNNTERTQNNLISRCRRQSRFPKNFLKILRTMSCLIRFTAFEPSSSTDQKS